MISLILLKLFTFSQILQGVPKLSHPTVYMYIYCIYTHKHTHILYMELMKLQEIPNMDKGIAIPVTE